MNDNQCILMTKAIARTGALIAFAILGVMAAILIHQSVSSKLFISAILAVLPILCWAFCQTMQVKSIEKLISNYADNKVSSES